VGSMFYDPTDYGREQALVAQWRSRMEHNAQDDTGSTVE
jgi:hypothetical protein